jgi:hypothetical protein
MDFGADIREFVINNLPHDPCHRSELERKTPSELLIFYVNWRSRLVPIMPRQVHCSHALTSNPFSNGLPWKPALDAIILKLEAGHDLTGHLSRGI